MSKSQRLREQDVRAVYRLLSDLREMRHDQPAMHRHLVDTLVGLVGATGGFVGGVNGWKPAPATGARWGISLKPLAFSAQGRDVVSWVMRGLAHENDPRDDPSIVGAVLRPETVETVPFHRLGFTDADIRRDFALFAEVRSQANHVDHLLSWFHTRPVAGSDDDEVFAMALHRYGQTEKLFGPRETALVRLLFEELHWLHATGRLATAAPDVGRLTPRVREVFDRLLAGQAPKRIARELGLSVLTVRGYIKQIYATTGVGGRHELMSKFVRTHGSGAAVPDRAHADGW